ncbi:MAG: 3-oxoacyl-ACP synthase [Desulfovibrio sp. S3730MH75]|nr:MAG: 3-oxoacyl-ACP synthase [Desulfovibrio sp. S3730MH75]
MSNFSYIRGFGYYVPERVYTNADLEKFVDTTDEWITTRTGITERRIVESQTSGDLAFEASQKALKDADMDADELTHILVATFTGDMYIPSTACLVMKRLGIKNKIPMDIGAACSGFVFAIEAARAFVALNPDSKILVCGSEVVTSRVNWEDRSTCVLFGDGAGSIIITSENSESSAKIIDVLLCSEGEDTALLVRGGGSSCSYKMGDVVGNDHFVHMNGREIYKKAVRAMPAIANELLAKHGLTSDDIDVLVPHQANMRIIEAVGKKLKIPREQVFVNVNKFGNTSAASIPIALAEARQTGFIKKGDLTLITTFGGGLTWGAALVQF